MAILRNHSCGHVQRICPRCLSVGCGYSNCPECIGHNSAMVCKVCGCNDVLSMENYQYKKVARANEVKRESTQTNLRMRNLEQASNIRYISGYEGSHYSGFPNIFKLQYIIILIVCYGLSSVMHYKDYNGLLGIIVGLINIVGGLFQLVINILLNVGGAS